MIALLIVQVWLLLIVQPQGILRPNFIIWMDLLPESSAARLIREEAAISNGLQILREPRVTTGRRTMLYMAVSLSLTASGLILCYLLAGVSRVQAIQA